MTMIKIKNATASYNFPEKKVVFKDICFEIQESDFVSILGPSGCGKTTLLKTIVGLLKLCGGAIRLNNQIINSPSHQKLSVPKDMILTFQDDNKSLFPWMTVKKNIEWGMSRNRQQQDHEASVLTTAEQVGLQQNDLNKFPPQLSGGLRQRLSLARALSAKPKVLLLDEPFNALDTFSRCELEGLLYTIWDKEKLTVLLVTHEVEEAIFLSKKIILLTSLPASIKEVINVDLKFPRDRTSKQFTEIRNQILLLTGVGKSVSII